MPSAKLCHFEGRRNLNRSPLHDPGSPLPALSFFPVILSLFCEGSYQSHGRNPLIAARHLVGLTVAFMISGRTRMIEFWIFAALSLYDFADTSSARCGTFNPLFRGGRGVRAGKRGTATPSLEGGRGWRAGERGTRSGER